MTEPTAQSEPKVKPDIIALVICDDIYKEGTTGKTALVGLFHSIRINKCPYALPKMAVFVSVTGLRPNSSAKLEIVHGENDRPIVVIEGKFPDTINPLQVAELNFILNGVKFELPGTYFVNFWSNGHLVVMRRFEVIETKPPTGEEKKQ